MDPLDLIFGDDPKLIQAQSPVQRPDPIQRPAPIQRPGEAAPRAQAPRSADPPRFQFKPADAPSAPEGGTYAPAPRFEGDPLDLIFGDNKPKPQAQAPQMASPGAPPFPGYKDPKHEGWLEWMDNNIRGRVDPRYKDARSLTSILKDEIFDDNSDDARATNRQMTIGALLTPDDAAHADIARNALGNRFIGMETDAYGAKLVRFKDRNGNPTTAYINKPGLDAEDVDNALLVSVPYMIAGRIMGGGMIGGRIMGGLTRNMGTPMKMMGQAGGAFATSVSGDMAARHVGSEQQPDLGRASVAAVAGGVVEGLSPVVGHLWRKLAMEPSLYNKATGQLTPKGADVAKKAGFDPADITQMTAEMAETFAQKYAQTRSPVVAGQSARTGEFDIPVTRSQMTKDPAGLLNEKAMRYGAFGPSAKDTMQGFDQRQAAAIEAAAVGPDKSIARTINPSRPAQGLRPGSLGDDIQSGVTAASNAAKTDAKLTWQQVGPLQATPDAMDKLPAAIAKGLGDFAPNITKETAPRTSQMLDYLRKIKAGDGVGSADEFMGGVHTPSLMAIQRSLGKMTEGAGRDFDGSAARAVYRAFNQWIDDASNAAMLKGDPGTAAMWKMARDRTREMKEIFGERDIAGMTTPGRQIVTKMLQSDALAPEQIVRSLFTVDSGAVPKQGTLEALNRIKSGLDRYLPRTDAAATWNDIRLAHWLNLINTPSGQLQTPHMLGKRIDQAIHQQGSIMRRLYQPEEIALIRRFGAAMKDVAYKDPNPSGTATSNLFYGSQWGQSLLSALGSYNGPLAKIMQSIMQATPIKNTIGSVAAGSAVTGRVRTVNPSFGAHGAAVAAQQE